jgi:hypothetical protein
MFAASVHEKANRVATETPVTATVVKVWTERAPKGTRLLYYAHLIFDRKQSDGEVVHCDVPKVGLGPQPATVGGAVTIYPRNTSCWEPDVICENCDAPYPYMSLRGMLIVASMSGLICLFLTLRVLRDIRRKGTCQS